MNVLLDSHALLWAYFGDPKLSRTAAATLLDPANTLFVSTATHWEIAIKVSIGKLKLKDAFPDFYQKAIADQGFLILPIDSRHTSAIASMPHPTKHRDPFDRMLASQALVDSLTLLSSDPRLDAYGVTRLW